MGSIAALSKFPSDVLLGDVNPSGHLPYTIGKSLQDYGPGAQIQYYPNGVIPQQNFDERLLIDYRWFDTQNITPRYPFGHGLSYTTFSLEDLKITPTSNRRPAALPARRPVNKVEPPTYQSKLPNPRDLLFPAGWRKLKKYIYPYITSVEDVIPKGEYPYPDMTPRELSQAGGGEGGNPSLYDVLATVEVTIVNTGERDGQAVPQLYIAFPQDFYEDIDATMTHHNSDPEHDDYGVFESLERDSPTADAPASTREHIAFPPLVLRAFEKVHTYSAPSKARLRRADAQGRRDGAGIAGDRQTVTFELTRRDLSYWSVRRQNWVVPQMGSFGVKVGLSSRDIRVEGTLW